MSNSKTIKTFQDPKGRWTIHQGDVTQVLATISPNLFDAICSDPPYGIKFMGHAWDSEVPPTTVWQAVLRVCKPGAHLLAFGGSKTFHRQACFIEDAEWELRDTICWLYGEGMPKAHDISKAIDKELGIERHIVGEKRNRHHRSTGNYRFGCAKRGRTFPITVPESDAAKNWDGYSTALKPAWEPIVVGQKPRRGTFAKNALRFGCGGLNVRDCLIGLTGGTKRSHQAAYPRLESGEENRQHWARSGHAVEPTSLGRWPANLILDEQAAEELDCQSGKSKSRRGKRRLANRVIGNGKTLNSFQSKTDVFHGYNDEGGASRFFYCPKASRKEQEGNDHPTVKPLALCEYLARLVLPPKRKTPRRLIVPYCGSGSEMLGALMAGWDHVTGIELDPVHVQTARRRLGAFCKTIATPA